MPAALGGVLALVYALGAISVYGQMKGAGLNGQQVMPLVPVEQILGRGIGSIASMFAQTLVVLFLGTLFIALYWSERDERTFLHPKDWPKRLYFGPALVVAFLGIATPWRLAAVISVGVLSLLGLWAVAGVVGISGWRGIVLLGCGSIATVIPTSIASSLIQPSPLPSVSIVRSYEPEFTGALVAETGSNWYVALRNHDVRAIPNSEVTRSTISYPERDPGLSLIQLIFG